MKEIIVGMTFSIIGGFVLNHAGVRPFTGLGIVCLIVGYNLFSEGQKKIKLAKQDSKVYGAVKPSSQKLVNWLKN
jgi:hypothetical protein